MDHTHHHHKGEHQKAKDQTDQLTERLEERTLHGHEHAMHKDTTGHPPHGEHGHDHHRMMIDDFQKRFWVSLVLAIPVIILSPMVQHILGFSVIPLSGRSERASPHKKRSPRRAPGQFACGRVPAANNPGCAAPWG